MLEQEYEGWFIRVWRKVNTIWFANMNRREFKEWIHSLVKYWPKWMRAFEKVFFSLKSFFNIDLFIGRPSIIIFLNSNFELLQKLSFSYWFFIITVYFANYSPVVSKIVFKFMLNQCSYWSNLEKISEQLFICIIYHCQKSIFALILIPFMPTDKYWLVLNFFHIFFFLMDSH